MRLSPIREGSPEWRDYQATADRDRRFEDDYALIEYVDDENPTWQEVRNEKGE